MCEIVRNTISTAGGWVQGLFHMSGWYPGLREYIAKLKIQGLVFTRSLVISCVKQASHVTYDVIKTTRNE